MTLLDNIKMFLALIDEYSDKNKFFTDDEDVKLKTKLLYGPAYIELAGKKMLSKTKELSFTYTGEDAYEEVSLPSNARKVKKIFCLDKNNKPATGDYSPFGDRKVLISKKLDIRYICEYIPNVTLINQETDDDFELEIPDEVAAALPYIVASDLFKTDSGQDYTAFEIKAKKIMSEIDFRVKGISVNISKGGF